MTPSQRETLQIGILRVLDANQSQFGLGLRALVLHLQVEAFPNVTAADIEPELEYLTDRGLTASVAKVLEPANRTWRRTATGRDYLSERGF